MIVLLDGWIDIRWRLLAHIHPPPHQNRSVSASPNQPPPSAQNRERKKKYIHSRLCSEIATKSPLRNPVQRSLGLGFVLFCLLHDYIYTLMIEMDRSDVLDTVATLCYCVVWLLMREMGMAPVCSGYFLIYGMENLWLGWVGDCGCGCTTKTPRWKRGEGNSYRRRTEKRSCTTYNIPN